MERKGYLKKKKNFGQFRELSVGIQDFMKCLLDTRSLSDRRRSKAVTSVLMCERAYKF